MSLNERLKARLRNDLRDVYFFFSRVFFDPIAAGNRVVGTIRALPIYGANLARYARDNQRHSLRPTFRDAWFRTFDRFGAAGSLTVHYFWQYLWAAAKIFDSGVHRHV